MVRLVGSLYNDAGEALASANVAIFPTSATADEDTGTGSATDTTTTNSSGVWSSTSLAANSYDVRITSGTSVRWRRFADEVQFTRASFGDDAGIDLGADSDIVIFNRSTALSADAEVTNVIEGTSDHPGVTANSLIISNITDNGDIMFAISDGGNSKGLLKLDGTNGKVLIHGTDTLSLNGTTLTSTAAELNILDGATVVVAEVNYLDLGATAVGTAIASKAVILDSNKDYTGIRNLTITGELDGATLDLSSSADIAGDLVLSGGADGALQFTNAGENSIKIPDNQSSALIIEEADNAYITFNTTNSSEAITVAKATTFSAGVTSTAASNTLGATSFNDASITNVNDIALDSISADATDINIAVTDNSATALTIKQGSDAYLIVDTANSSESVSIGTGISGTAITIGHGTSETTVGDNLTVTGDLTVSGTTTTVNSSTLTIGDTLIKLGQSYTGTAYDQGIVFTRGDGSSSNTANRAMLWDESADEFVFALTNTEAGTTTGNVTLNDLANLHVGGLTIDDDIDLAGSIDVDGTANLDAVDIDGAVQIDSTITVGADDQGYDIIFYGDAASANLTWDTSVDDLILNGAARIVVPDGQLVLGSTAVGSTAAELNKLDGAGGNVTAANLDALTGGSATALHSHAGGVGVGLIIALS